MTDIVERLCADAEMSRDCSSNWEAFDCSEAMREAADEIERLRLSLSEAISQRDAAFEMSKCECGTDEACRNLAGMQSDYERLARHIAPDVDAEYIWSHLPGQIIDAGLQLQESALSEARATGYREAYELRMKKFRSGCACHMNDFDEIVSMCQHHEALIAEARATGRREGMEEAARIVDGEITRATFDSFVFNGETAVNRQGHDLFMSVVHVEELLSSRATAIRAAMEKAE